MKVIISKNDHLEFIRSTSEEDDSFSYEMWFNGKCVIVLSLPQSDILHLDFGGEPYFQVDADLIKDFISEGSELLTKWKKEWIDTWKDIV